MTGSLQEKRGIYYCVLNYRTPEGKRKQKWITTQLPIKGNKRKAEKFLLEILHKYSEEDFIETSSSNFCQYMKEWLENKKSTVELSTWEGYQTYVEKHIIPYFKPMNLKLEDLTPSHFMDYNHFKFTKGRINGTGGLSIASVRAHSVVLKAALSEAVLKGLISRNPAQVPLPKKDTSAEDALEKVTFLSVEEANQLLKAFKGHRLQPMIYIALYYGLRRSEILGLKWEAVDFDKNRLYIQSTVVRNRTTVYKDRTKSKSSRRSFELIPDVREVLLKRKREQEKNRKFFGNEYFESDYVFTWDDGTTYQPDYITLTFRRELKKKGIPHMRFHDLRHSCASMLYEMGWSLKEIQEWLGHSNVKITGDIYVHIDKLRSQNMAHGLNNTFQL